MDFKSVPNKYRPIPFWSWNEMLVPETTREQVRVMHKAGIGGFFMHARGGLQTEYLSEEWFDNIEAASDEAAKYGMRAWAYDENGWPSGFGDGKVNGLGVRYQQKYLRMEVSPEHTETAICQNGEHWFYYEVNPFYVDTLDKEVIKEFIEQIYQPYYDRFQGRIEGFFTDEPQISNNGIPWSFVFEKEYRKRYEDELSEHLEELFLERGDYQTTRFRFWKMVTDLFSSAYMKQIYDWCDARGLKLTGHLLAENSLLEQLTTNGACMPHYEYFHIPGMDWLGRDIGSCLTPKQVSSVAEQLGREQVLSETFALCGHNVSFDELKGMYEWQLVHGINLLCQHLEGYSIRGMRKRDYPPAMFEQQPWWEDYRTFVDAMSREGMVLSKGREQCKVLLIHPQSKAWILYNGRDTDRLKDLNQELIDTMELLERKHIAYHLGDETIMERHARVEEGCIVIGRQRYSQVILLQEEVLFASTRELLKGLWEQGGQRVSAQELCAEHVVDSEKITYTCREMDDCRVHFFVNTNREQVETEVFVRGKRLDIVTGELEEFDGYHCFEPYGSLMLVEAKEERCITLDSEMDIVRATPNALTLDKCDYYFDGELQEKDGFVLNITEKANTLERPVDIHQDYYFAVKHVPESLFLACETPERFRIMVNGCELTKKPVGYFVDRSFLCMDIREYVREGMNTLSFDCHFEQSERVYENLKKAKVFESEKNKLSYDMEIEAVYLIGNFSVNTEGEWSKLPLNAERYCGVFEIDYPKTRLVPRDIHKKGFPFFSGSITLSGRVTVPEGHAVLRLERMGVNVVKIKIGGKEKTFLWNGDLIDLTGWAEPGENDIELTLTNNLRNLLGPHHLEMGECYAVRPGNFFKEQCVWNKLGNQWNEGYCFVRVGV